MNLSDYIAKAKKVLNEDSGAEGMAYKLTYKGSLPDFDESIVATSLGDDGKDKVCEIKFAVPHDPGCAANCLSQKGVEIVGLELLY